MVLVELLAAVGEGEVRHQQDSLAVWLAPQLALTTTPFPEERPVPEGAMGFSISHRSMPSRPWVVVAADRPTLLRHQAETEGMVLSALVAVVVVLGASMTRAATAVTRTSC
jgi:hypothetical protein